MDNSSSSPQCFTQCSQVQVTPLCDTWRASKLGWETQPQLHTCDNCGNETKWIVKRGRLSKLNYSKTPISNCQHTKFQVSEEKFETMVGIPICVQKGHTNSMQNSNNMLFALIGGVVGGSPSIWQEILPFLQTKAKCLKCMTTIIVRSHFTKQIVRHEIKKIPIEWTQKSKFICEKKTKAVSPRNDRLIQKYGILESKQLYYVDNMFYIAENAPEKLDAVLQNLHHSNDVHIRNSRGCTILDIARSKNNTESIQIIENFISSIS